MAEKRTRTVRHPLCEELARRYQPLVLPHEDATADDRIGSVYPLLLSKAAAFMDTLKPNQRSNYDIEDVMTELYIELRTKDDKFDPDKGKYTTFVGTLVDHLFSAIRDRSRTVHSPKNSGSRLAGYERSAAAGTLNSRQAVTARKIRSTRHDFGEVEDLPASRSHSKCAAEEAEAAETRRLATNALLVALSVLQPYEAAVAGKRWGLWGQEAHSVSEVCDSVGGEPSEVRDALRSAEEKIFRAVEHHPYSREILNACES